MGTYALATVTQTSPLKVRRDQELAEIYINLNFIGTVSVGDRVEIRYTGTNVDITSRLTNWGSYVPWEELPPSGVLIPAGSDLNSYTTPGQWYNPLNVEVAGFTNGPPSNAAGALVVLRSGSSAVIQFWHGFDANGTGSKIYRRRLYSGAWSAWKLMNPASWVGEASGGQRSGVTYHDVTVNFPSGLFSVAPKVFAQINNQAGGGNQLQVMIGNVTTESCVVGFFMITGTMNGHWCEANVFAIEPS